MDDNWNDILKEYIPIFSTASSELEDKLAVLSLIARIDDSHASIRNKGKVLENYWGIRWSPLELSFTENKFVVAGYFDDTLGKKIGRASSWERVCKNV